MKIRTQQCCVPTEYLYFTKYQLITDYMCRETALPCPGLRAHCVSKKSGHNNVVSLQNVFGLIEPNLILFDPKTVSPTSHRQESKLCQLRESRRC